MFRTTVLTLFPEMFPGPLSTALAGKALHNGLWSLETVQIRDFATDKHQKVDDTPYGGGAGMVMKPDVLDAAILAAKTKNPYATLIYFTPRGTRLTQPLAFELSKNNLILLCGRYEGVDQRLLDAHQPLEISIGDYILSGGEMAALTLLDACIRLLPGVVGDAESIEQESFANTENYACLLEYPHYTKPPLWNGISVPEVLLGGNHAHIARWRQAESERITRERRPDIWERFKTLKSTT